MKRSQLFSVLVLFASMLACEAVNPIIQSVSATRTPTVSIPVATRTPATQSESPLPSATPRPLPKGMPEVETNFDRTLQSLGSGEVGFFEAFAVEKYSDKDFAKPGTITFTVAFPADQKIFFNYGWCAKDLDILNQNLEHIKLKFFFDDQEIPSEYILGVDSTQDNGWECAHGGMLLSGWKPGRYKFRLTATFDEKINDGGSDFESGDYSMEYDVTVK